MKHILENEVPIEAAPSKHAITLDAGGAEILMHVGIDTVGLRGEGFEALVELLPGDVIERVVEVGEVD